MRLTLWYVTRASGIVMLVLLTTSVLLGILEVKRWRSPRWPRFVTAGLHRSISLLSVAFLFVHIATAVVDGFAPIGWLDAVIPFHSPYRPLWRGLGAVATDLLIALTITSLLRGRIGYRGWKAIHWAAYACWPIALLHGLGTGTDTRLVWVVGLNVVCLAAVVAAVLWRVAARVAQSAGAALAATSSVVVPVAIVAFLFSGPLRPGWARRAGTPASILSRRAAQVTPAPASTTADAFAGGFSDQLSGTLSQAGGTVTIAGSLAGSAPGVVRIVLQGTPMDDGGIQMTSSSAALGPSAQPTLYTGSVTGLRGDRLELSFSGPAGRSMSVSIRLAIDGSSVSGTVTSR